MAQERKEPTPTGSNKKLRSKGRERNPWKQTEDNEGQNDTKSCWRSGSKITEPLTFWFQSTWF